MKKIVTMSMSIILSFMFLGCAPFQRVPLSKDAEVKVKGKTCEISRYEKIDFHASTAAKAALGPLFAGLSTSAGNEIVAKNNIEDPAYYISQEIAGILKERFDVTFLPFSGEVSKVNDLDTIGKIYNKGDYILDVRTTFWGFAYFPGAWTKYKILYGAHLRIIETKSKKVLAEDLYFRQDDDSSKAPTYDDLVNNNAEGIKKELRKSADEAILFFKNNALNRQ